MKLSTLPLLASLGLVAAAPKEARQNGVQGFDISNWQPTFDFAGAYASGARFAIIKVCFGRLT